MQHEKVLPRNAVVYICNIVITHHLHSKCSEGPEIHNPVQVFIYKCQGGGGGAKVNVKTLRGNVLQIGEIAVLTYFRRPRRLQKLKPRKNLDS